MITSLVHVNCLLLHLDTEPLPHALENDIHGLNDFQFGMGFAVKDHLVFRFLAFADVHVVFFGKAVVPAAVPGRELVSVFLPRVGKLGARERLHVDEAIGIRIRTQVDLARALEFASARAAIASKTVLRISVHLIERHLHSAKAIVQTRSYLAVMRNIERCRGEIEILKLCADVLSKSVLDTASERCANLFVGPRAIDLN